MKGLRSARHRGEQQAVMARGGHYCAPSGLSMPACDPVLPTLLAATPDLPSFLQHLYREALHGNGSARPPPPALAAASPPTATRPNIAPANARPPSAGSSPALPTSTVKRTPSANGSSLTTGGSRPPTGGTTGTRAVDLNTGVGESDRAAQAGGAGVAPDDARPGSAAGGGPGGEAGVGIAERLMSHQGSGTSGGQGAAGYGAGLGPGVVPPDRWVDWHAWTYRATHEK